MRYTPKFNRHLSILLIAQAITGSTMPVLFLISGLIGTKISPTLKLSTLPMALLIVGVAIASPLASFLMSRLGRKGGHLIGLAVTLLGVALAGFSLHKNSFLAYCISTLICGMGSSFNNQIRFTAAAEAEDEQKPLAHSWVLMFGLFAAILGPWIVKQGHQLLTFGEYTGSTVLLFIALAALTILMTWLPNKKITKINLIQSEKINHRKILSQAKFWLPTLSGITSFATMTLLMSATPLEMYELKHFSLADTTMTIQSHIMAMYLPSLFSGLLISWLGIRRLIIFGITLFLICILIAYQSSHFHHYWWALVLLGVGWNFLFLAGSTMISQSYSGAEGFFAQGANDTLVYGTQAIASLVAGWLLFEIGWQNLVLVPIPLLFLLLSLTWLYSYN